MSETTKLRLRKIDAIIRKIRIVQSEAIYTPYFEQAIECLKLTKRQITIDGENRDRYEAKKLLSLECGDDT